MDALCKPAYTCSMNFGPGRQSASAIPPPNTIKRATKHNTNSNFKFHYLFSTTTFRTQISQGAMYIALFVFDNRF